MAADALAACPAVAGDLHEVVDRALDLVHADHCVKFGKGLTDLCLVKASGLHPFRLFDSKRNVVCCDRTELCLGRSVAQGVDPVGHRCEYLCGNQSLDESCVSKLGVFLCYFGLGQQSKSFKGFRSELVVLLPYRIHGDSDQFVD